MTTPTHEGEKQMTIVDQPKTVRRRKLSRTRGIELYLWIAASAALFFTLGHEFTDAMNHQRIEHFNREYESLLNSEIRARGEMPKTYCAIWYKQVPVRPDWDIEASPTYTVADRAVCMAGDRIYDLRGSEIFPASRG